MARRGYAGGAVRTTLTASIASSGGGTVTIASATGWPDGSGGAKFHIVVDPGNSSEEKILVDSRSGTTLTFSSGGRGADGTLATSHSSGATIWLVFTAVDADEANAHINATASAHAATAVSFSPTGNIAATTVQAAIAEVDSETDSRLDTAESTITSHGTRITERELLGTKGYAEVTANQGSLGAITDLTSLSVTFTAVAGRRYKITGEAMFYSATANQIGGIFIREGSTTQLQYRQFILAASLTPKSVTIHRIVTPSAGSTTYKLSAAALSGTDLTMQAGPTSPAFILVEDIGT
jgi:hypothetical protein